MDPKSIDGAATPLMFQAARQQAAKIPDVKTYEEWCRFTELRYDFLPSWYWQEPQRQRKYVEYVHAAVRWYDEQRQVSDTGKSAINALNAMVWGKR
jgi:hypothetical protein